MLAPQPLEKLGQKPGWATVWPSVTRPTRYRPPQRRRGGTTDQAWTKPMGAALPTRADAPELISTRAALRRIEQKPIREIYPPLVYLARGPVYQSARASGKARRFCCQGGRLRRKLQRIQRRRASRGHLPRYAANGDGFDLWRKMPWSSGPHGPVRKPPLARRDHWRDRVCQATVVIS